MTLTTTETAWGETYDELAEAVLNDKGAPPFLLMAAFLHKHGEPRRLRALVSDAVDLDLRSHEPPRTEPAEPESSTREQ